MQIAALVSGGVDSAVSVHLLKEQFWLTTKLKKLLFTNKDLKKVTEKNKATDKALQEL